MRLLGGAWLEPDACLLQVGSQRWPCAGSHPDRLTLVACCSKEAQADAASEPLLSSFLYASVLSHDNFERSLAFVLSNRLSDATLMSTELFEVFYSILRRCTGVWGVPPSGCGVPPSWSVPSVSPCEGSCERVG